MNSNLISGAGEMVGAWALHAGDVVSVADHGETLAAKVKALDGHDLTWESLDHQHRGHLHYSPYDLVNRLSANRTVSV